MLKYKINKLIKVYTNDYKDEEKYTKKELEILKEKSKKIKQVSSKLALKHKILNLNTSKENISAIYKKFITYKENITNDETESSKLNPVLLSNSKVVILL